MASILILSLLGLITWFWIDSLRAKEKAMIASSQACQQIQVQFLDQTASLKRIRFSRDKRGRLVFLREYVFDYSRDRQSRQKGRVIINGMQVLNVLLDEDDGTTIL